MPLHAAKRAVGSLRRNGLRKTLAICGRLAYRGAWFTLTTRHSFGTNIYDRDWDALIILDACRVDALRAVADEFPFLNPVDSIRSVGSHSHEWMAKTFTDAHRDAINRTTYVVGNGFAQRTFENNEPPVNSLIPSWLTPFETVDAAAFGHLDGVWDDGHDDQLGNVPPRYITNRAIAAGRSDDTDRLLVHYNQPHTPFLSTAIDDDRATTDTERNPFDPLRNGTGDRTAILQGYLDNLRLVLEDVALLLDNLDAETVVITADHGEAFGDRGEYNHSRATLNPAVRRVPWVETTATDTGDYIPPSEPADSGDKGETTDLKTHLADLGYID